MSRILYTSGMPELYWSPVCQAWMVQNLEHSTSLNQAERYLWFDSDEDAVLFVARWSGNFIRRL